MAELLVWSAAAYAGTGLLFAAAFVCFGIERLDDAARHAPWGFRVIVAPGCAAFWPLLLLRWLRSAKEGT